MPKSTQRSVAEHERWRAPRLILMRGVDKYDAGDFRRVHRVVDARIQSAERVTDINERHRNAGAMKQLVQIGRHRFAGAREWTHVAPAKSGAIERARASLLRDLRLDS